MREIVIDTETTGLNFKSGDRVIEVACLELINHIATDKHLQFYCSTEKLIDDSAIKIHGLTNNFLSKYPSFKDQSKKFLDFIKNDRLIIHNAGFDIGFINNELEIIGLKHLKNEYIDTVSFARKVLNTRIANLDYLCRRFSIDLSERKFHGALLDCQLLSEVYLELIGGKQISLQLNDVEEVRLDKVKKTKNSNIAISNFLISNEDIEMHKKLVKGIKNCLWEKINY